MKRNYFIRNSAFTTLVIILSLVATGRSGISEEIPQLKLNNDVVLPGGRELGKTNPRIQLDNGKPLLVLQEDGDNGKSEEKKEDEEEGYSSRIIRLIIYFIMYGVVLEISILIARYQRHNDTHDENHGFMMIVTGLTALGMDIWYILANKENLTENSWAKLKLIFIIGVTLFFLLQIVLGVQTRVKMRVLKYEPKYYSRRNFHITIGILLWLGTKMKLWIVCKMEDDMKSIGFDLQYIALIYFGVILIIRVILEIFMKNRHEKFRNKTIVPDPNLFNSEVKKKHGQLLDFMMVKYLEDIKPLFKESINWVMIEDRIFDIQDLDHPGGRFIIPQITGRDISRYFYGSQPFDLFGKSVYIRHLHSAHAFNYLEKRFIGFMDPPSIIIQNEGYRGDINERRLSVVSFREINDQREEVYKRMDNMNHKYTFQIASNEPIKPYIAIIYFKSSNHKFSLSPDPFQYFGKFFNLRIDGKIGCRQYSCVMSLSPDHVQFRQGLYKKFLDYTGLYSEAKFNESTTTLENPNTTINALPLVIKKYSKSKGFSKKIYSAQQGKSIYEIRGPFGVGLGIKKFSYGRYCFFGMGTGNNAFVDLIDFLARKMVYDYTHKFHGEEQANQMDPWKSDFDLIFQNDIQFSFYMSFKTGTEFERLFGENLKMISKIKQKYDTNVVDKILVRCTEKNGLDHSNYPGVDFLQNKVESSVLKTFLSRLGANFEGGKCNIGKVIAVGNRKFTNEISEGIKKNKIDPEKLLIV